MKSTQQITLRLPHDLAQRLAANTPTRKRNQFVVDLVRRELDRESRELEEAAQSLSLLEQTDNPDDADWLELDDALAGGDVRSQGGRCGEADEKRQKWQAESGRHGAEVLAVQPSWAERRASRLALDQS